MSGYEASATNELTKRVNDRQRLRFNELWHVGRSRPLSLDPPIDQG